MKAQPRLHRTLVEFAREGRDNVAQPLPTEDLPRYRIRIEPSAWREFLRDRIAHAPVEWAATINAFLRSLRDLGLGVAFYLAA